MAESRPDQRATRVLTGLTCCDTVLRLAFLLFFGVSARGNEFELSGELASTFFSPGRPSYTNFRPFQVTLRDCQVFIHLDPSPRDQGIEYFEFASDGTNSSYITKYAMPSTQPELPPKKKRNDSTLVNRPSVCPPLEARSVIPIWLAYGSACFFSDRDDPFLPALHLFLGTPIMKRADSVELKAEWRQSKEPPFLVEFFADYLAGRLVTGGRSYDLPPELATGATNSILTTSAWTNVNGLAFPLQFTFTTFAVSADASRKPAIQSIARGVTKTFTAQTLRENFHLTLSDTTRIVEHRYLDELWELNHGKPAAYITTNKIEWPVEKIIAETKIARDRSRKVSRMPTSKIILSSLLALVLLGPPTFLVTRWWRGLSAKRQTKTNM